MTTTIPDLLARRLAEDPGGPLVTFYDDASSERTELSATTYANWLAKNANLLVEELDLAAGDLLLVDLPAHWLVPVLLGAAWSAGVAVTTDPDQGHDAVVCGPDSVASYAAAGGTVLACSLRPFATPFAEPLPPGVVDHGTAWPGQSDVFLGLDPVTPDTPAWVDADGAPGHALLVEAAAEAALAGRTRVLTDRHPASGRGVPLLLAPLLAGGSLVLVRHPDAEGWEHRAEQEQASLVLRA
ncbi:TIGR03089 family protein [Nocardioides scoriae]|uniref:TIGR03089 family protein n=1 Tax=Nocardioides scoriae TaxID=642780 RepID=A0A1H1QZ08_9ACTN|nr:TIGR03089 family protein [Nocardioides scoriae]SDS28019.1 TIGR03089 family protein [Nocardioides scoriae]